MKFSAYFVFILTSICAASAFTRSSYAGDLSRAEFEKLHKELQPDPNAAWRRIPWKISVLEANKIATTENKPIFIWAMDGHPLGCT